MALEKAFGVKVNGTNNPVEEVDVGGSSVSLRVQNRIQFGDTITVSYTVPVSSKITDIFGNELASFSDEPVDNELPDPSDSDPPVFDDASTDKEGREISISFNEDIAASIPPNPVVNLNELDSGPDGITDYKYFLEWRWSPGQSDETNEVQYYQYRFRRVTIPASDWSAYTRVDVGSVRINNLFPNAQYEIGVVPVNVGGQGDEVTDVADTPEVIAGTQPINFRTTNKGRKLVNGSYQFFIDLAFQLDPENTQPVTRYEYRFKLASASDWGTWTDNGTNLTFTLDNVTDDVEYNIEVRMVTVIGSSIAASLNETVSFAPPPTVDNFVASGVRGGDKTNGWTYAINLSWDEPDHDDTNEIDNYRYRYKLNSTNTWGGWVTVVNTATTVTITGLTHTVGYDLEFQAQNHEGNSPKQTVDNLVIFTAPPAVTGIMGIADKTSIEWAWVVPTTDASNMIDDILVRTRAKTGTWSGFTSKGASGGTHELSSLTDGTTYQITVRTSNSAGNTDVVYETEYNVLAAAPYFEITVFTATIISTVVQTFPLPDTKFIQYEYRANSSAAWGAIGSGGPRTAAYYNAVPANHGEFDFISQNFEFSFVRGQGQMRVRGVGAAPGYAPVTEWRVLTIPAAT